MQMKQTSTPVQPYWSCGNRLKGNLVVASGWVWHPGRSLSRVHASSAAAALLVGVDDG